MDGERRAAKRRVRHHSLLQITTRPVTIKTCSGPVVVAAVVRGNKVEIVIEHPSDAEVKQPTGENDGTA